MLPQRGTAAPARAPCEGAENWRKITPFPHFHDWQNILW